MIISLLTNSELMNREDDSMWKLILLILFAHVLTGNLLMRLQLLEVLNQCLLSKALPELMHISYK